MTMVQGPRNKTRKSPSSVQLDYIIHIQEIKPWPPSQSLRTLRAVLVQWEHGEKNSGLTNQVVPSIGTGSSVGDGRIEFNESFRLPVTLTREISIKGGDGSTFQKNCIEFNLYVPRRERTVKGQLLGTAVLDLAECGVVKECLCISVPINCKRTYWNTVQPLLFLKIQPVERNLTSSSSRGSLMREASMDRNNCESVSGVSEEYAEEAEAASFTTDDDEAAAAESNGSSSPQSKQNGTVVVNGSGREAKPDEEQVTESHVKSETLARLGSFLSQRPDDENASDLEREDRDTGRTRTHTVDEARERRVAEEKEQHIPDEPCSGFSQLSATKENFAVDSNFSNIDKLKLGKSVRSSADSSRSNGSVQSNQFFVADAQNHARVSINSELKDDKMCTNKTRNLHSDSRIQHLEHRMEILERELREAAAIEVSLYSVVAEHEGSMTKVHAPARRLSRLYFHASKQDSKSGRWGAAKSILSGLVLVSKACGNDVPRLTFWLSNSVVLRVIISKSFGEGNTKGKKNSSPLKWEAFPSKTTRIAIEESYGDWENPLTFVAALEKVESWIFSRIIESIWWQTFTPHMQLGNAKEILSSMDSESSKLYQRSSSSIDQEQGNFSMELWKKAFGDACERICPVRAGGHNCGCLPVLSRVIMEQLIARLDVAMFNAILRESADEIPTDPVSDPITDAEVLPIPAGKASFGAGAQLKNAIGNWSRWLTDLFGIDEDELHEDNSETADEDERITSHDTSSKSFHLLNALSDLMMLPKDMLLSSTIRKEVCPTFGPPLIRRVVDSFVPDEFCSDPIPTVLLEALNSEDPFDSSDDDCIMNFPCGASPIVYQPPSVASVANILGEISSNHSQLTRSRSSVLKKSQTSDDELDELDSPLKSIIIDGFQASPKSGWMLKENGSRNALRYQLLRDMWMKCD